MSEWVFANQRLEPYLPCIFISHLLYKGMYVHIILKAKVTILDGSVISWFEMANLSEDCNDWA